MLLLIAPKFTGPNKVLLIDFYAAVLSSPGWGKGDEKEEMEEGGGQRERERERERERQRERRRERGRVELFVQRV